MFPLQTCIVQGELCPMFARLNKLKWSRIWTLSGKHKKWPDSSVQRQCGLSVIPLVTIARNILGTGGLAAFQYVIPQEIGQTADFLIKSKFVMYYRGQIELEQSFVLFWCTCQFLRELWFKLGMECKVP